MKLIHIAALAAAVAIITTLFVVPIVAASTVSYTHLDKPVIVRYLPFLSLAQDAWVHNLELCESNGNPLAVNPKDRDGTPSYGAFQFKPSTLWYYAAKYGIPVGDGDYMLYSRQLAVVQQMVLHRNQINWQQQFPVCVEKYGEPPTK